jgi:hypothetical protein
MAKAVRLYSTSAHSPSATSHVLIEADCEIAAAIAHAETCACDGDEFDVTVNDHETGRGYVIRLNLGQNA